MSVNHNTLVTIPATISSTSTSHVYTFQGAQSGQSSGQTYDGTSELVYSVYLTDRTIKFQAGTWSDDNTTLIPSQVLYNSTNGLVECGAVGNNQQYGAFTSPFFSASTSGGGTSSEGVLVPSAVITKYGGLTGNRFEQRGYASGDYALLGSGTAAPHWDWTVSTGTNDLQHHISNLAAGVYFLYDYDGSATPTPSSYLTLLATLVATPDSKKVFCNFW